MGKCVYCGNYSKNKNKASLHRFPRDAAVREQWIKFIGRENWTPKDSSYLCTDHFHKDCFNVHHSNRITMKPGSVSTILTCQETFQEHSNILVESNHGNINESIVTSEEIPEVSMCVEYINSPTSSREIFVEESQPSTSKKNVTKFKPMTAYENMHHDHHYERTPASTLKKLSNLWRKLDSSLKNNKLMKRKLKRLKIKVHTLKEVANGYLTIPSNSVVQICLTTELLFRKACNSNSGKPPIERNFPCILATRAFEQATRNNNLFLELQQHDTEMFSVDEFISHTNRLIKTIIEKYIELRIYAATKQCASAITGTNMRHFLTRSIVWANQ